MLSRNVGIRLQIPAASHPRRKEVQIKEFSGVCDTNITFVIR